MNKEVELLTLDTDINVNKTKVQCSIKTSRKIKKEQRKQFSVFDLLKDNQKFQPFLNTKHDDEG